MNQRYNRRSFSKAALATSICASSQSLAAPLAPSAKVHDIKVVSQTPDLYCGWPTLTRLSDGQLMLVWSGGRESHVCPFGRVESMRSRDNGETWTWPRTLLDGGIDDRDAGIVQTTQGSILVTTFTSLAYEEYTLKKVLRRDKDAADAWPEERLQRWLGVHNRLTEPERKNELGQWMIRSTDGGITWSARYPTIVNSPHGPIQLSDGRLLYAGKRLWTQGREMGVCESRDDGQTWKWLAGIPTRNGDQSRNYHELHAAELGDGRIIAHIRNQNKSHDRETLQTESNDGGKTWTVPHSIGVWGLPSFLTKLADGRLMMSYGYRRKPFGNQARVSEDGGRTWSQPVVISDDGAGGDLGYPSTVQLEDGSLITVWYEKMKDRPKAVLRQARWEVG